MEKIELLQSYFSEAELFEIAKTAVAPDWATHIAVRNNGSKKEPCVWNEKLQAYLDEPLAEGEQWAAGYKECYWTFISLDELGGNSAG